MLAALYCAWKPYCEEASTSLERNGWIDDSVAYVQQAAADAAGYTVESSHGICLGAGYFTAYHLVPGGA